MAVERGYERQVGTPQSAALPMASPEAFGAGLGSAIADVGVTIKKLQTDQQITDFNARFSKARLDLDKASIDARSKAQAGAAGHADTMQAAWDSQRNLLLEGVTDRRLRNRAAEQLDEFGSRFVSSEYAFEQGKRVEKSVFDQEQASQTGANRARLAHDPQSFAEELSLGRQAIDALEIPADAKDKLHRFHDETVSIGYLNGLNDSDPAAARLLIDAGAFNSLLTPQQIEAARNGAEVEIRRKEAASQHQQAVEAQQLRDQVSSMKTLNENGVDIPDAQLADFQTKLTAIGDKSGATEIAVIRTKNGISRETLPWTPQQYDAAINALAAKPGRTPAEDLRLDYLRKIQGPRTAQFNSNPGAWAAGIGMAPPALNFADPASIAARQSWQRSVSAAAGRPVPLLTKNEAADLAAQAAASPKGRIAVADQLAPLGGASAMAAARQVAPADPMLARLVLLRPADRAATVNGAEARRANTALVDGANGNTARSSFVAGVGASAGLLAPQDLGATFEVARNLYADWALRNGVQEFDEGQFRASVHRALGGTTTPDGVKLGGLGIWNKRVVLLPQGLSQDAFDSQLSRYRIDPKAATAPVFADGTPMTAEQLRSYRPVQRPDGGFEFHGPNDTVAMNRAHRPFVLRFTVRPGTGE